MDVKKFKKKHRLSNADVIQVISRRFPKFQKYQLYMVCNPDQYGVVLSQDAEDALRNVYNRKENRKKSRQLTVRVYEEVFCTLKKYCEMRDITVQDFIEEAIIQSILSL